MLVEGEWCADALVQRGVLAMTSGSASSAEAADWRPLTGRDIMIWPDNDEAGQSYAAAAAEKLSALGCRVCRLDVAQLGLAAKQDAVDWLNVHPNATAAEILSLPCVEAASVQEAPPPSAPPQSSETCEYAGGQFVLRDQGVYHDVEGQPARWICGWLKIEAATRDGQSREWGRLLAVRDEDGVRHQWPMPAEALVGDGLDVLRELARLGLVIAPGRKARDLVLAYIQVWPLRRRARCVDRLGWHGEVYATPDESIGVADEMVVLRGGSAQAECSAAGTVEDWRNTVAFLAVGNTRLAFALSAAFAAPLAHLVGEDSGGFHLRGPSSGGKTTALRAAASVWGKPSAYMRLWRATANGLEGLASIHNDGLLILDELSQIDPREAGEAAYLLANGKGKARASRSGEARQSASWRLLFLSSGEESLSALLARVGKRTNAGQEIRLADIEADAGAGMGIFEQLHGKDSAAALAKAINDSSSVNHGTVGREWLRRVVTDRSALPKVITDGVRDFVREVVPAGASGQVERVARRFGLVAVAGELATAYGLSGWSEGEADRSAKACFSAWLDGYGGIGNREERALLAQVRGFIDQHGASRFQPIDATGDARIINRVGFWRETPEGVREYLVLHEAFKSEVCSGFDPKAAAKTLLERGWLVGSDGRSTQRVRLPGMGQVRVHVFSTQVWEGEL
jgi:putative DNA primase/helicase